MKIFFKILLALATLSLTLMFPPFGLVGVAIIVLWVLHFEESDKQRKLKQFIADIQEDTRKREADKERKLKEALAEAKKQDEHATWN